MLVIGHRGACGYRPENTLAAHEMAVRLGADRVECDVVPTADGVLVLRHEAELSGTTDIARRPDLEHLRRCRGGLDSRRPPGWFVEDLTLAQVRSVRAVEPMPTLRPVASAHDGLLGVPTLAELLTMLAWLSVELGRDVSVAVEVKEPSVFARLGLDAAQMLEAELAAPTAARLPVVLQCFDPRFLRRLRERGCELPLVQLLRPSGAAGAFTEARDAPGAPGWPSADLMCSDAGLSEISRYAQVLAPRKDLVVPLTADGSCGEANDLPRRAHARGLEVHVFSLRDENRFLPPALRVGADPAAHGRAAEEYAAYVEAGVDGVFSDHPDTAVRALRAA